MKMKDTMDEMDYQITSCWKKMEEYQTRNWQKNWTHQKQQYGHVSNA